MLARLGRPQHPWIAENLQRRAVQPGGREYPVSVQQLGSAARRARRIGNARFAGGWRLKRSWRTRSPRFSKPGRIARRRRFCSALGICRCGAATFTILSADLSQAGSVWCTAASATISSRSRSLVRARTGLREALAAAAGFARSGNAAPGGSRCAPGARNEFMPP